MKTTNRIMVLIPLITAVFAGTSVGYQYQRSARLTRELHRVEAELKRLDPTGASEREEQSVAQVPQAEHQGR